MFSSFVTVSTFALAALASITSVAAAPMAHGNAHGHELARRAKPAGWPDKLLENYDVYHARYNKFGCSTKHSDKAYFNSCCTPLLAGKTFSSAQTAKCLGTVKPTSTKITATAKPTTPVKASGGDVFTGGKGTFFFQNGAAGACGKKHPDSFPLVALDFRRYGPDNRASPDCGRQVLITNKANGKTCVATVADDCPTCTNKNSLDLSTGAFDQLASRNTGEIDIEWKFIS